MATPILDIPTVAASQNQKEVTINDAIAALEAAGNDVTTVTVDDTNALTITDGQWRGAGTLRIDPDAVDAPTGAITLTCPGIKRWIVLVNKTGQTVNASISGQTEDAVEVSDGAAVSVVSDGTDLRASGGGSSGGTTAWTALTDTPASYSGQAGKVPRVNSGETALEFATVATAELTVTDDTGVARTLALSDAGSYVRMDNGSANTVTVPPNSDVAFEVGTQITVHQVGAGQTTIAAGSGVTINTPETLKLRSQHSSATLIKVATDEWDLVGDLEAGSGGTGDNAADIAVFVAGLPADGGTVMQFVAARALTIPSGATGSYAYAATTATAQADFDLEKNGTSAGTVSFAIGANTGTFTLASDMSLAAGDRLSIVAPSPQDATLADLSITIAATKG